MRYLFILFLAAASLPVAAQMYNTQSYMPANSYRSVKKARFTLTTFRFKDTGVNIQRYEDSYLNEFYGDNANQNRVITAIQKLQPHLNNMKSYVIDNRREIGFIDVGKDLIHEIEREGINFDCTHFWNELHFYEWWNKQFAAARDAEFRREMEAKAEERKRYAREEAEKERRRDSVRKAEDEEREAKRREDERKEAEAEAKAEAEHKKYLIKKYGTAIAKRLHQRELWIGMTAGMVTDGFGDADHIKRSTTKAGTIEDWYYSAMGCYLCQSSSYRVELVNGKVTKIDEWVSN